MSARELSADMARWERGELSMEQFVEMHESEPVGAVTELHTRLSAVSVASVGDGDWPALRARLTPRRVGSLARMRAWVQRPLVAGVAASVVATSAAAAGVEPVREAAQWVVETVQGAFGAHDDVSNDDSAGGKSGTADPTAERWQAGSGLSGSWGAGVGRGTRSAKGKHELGGGGPTHERGAAPSGDPAAPGPGSEDSGPSDGGTPKNNPGNRDGSENDDPESNDPRDEDSDPPDDGDDDEGGDRDDGDDGEDPDDGNDGEGGGGDDGGDDEEPGGGGEEDLEPDLSRPDLSDGEPD